MSYTARTGPQGASLAERYTSFAVAMCLRFCWTVLAAPESYGIPSAKAAWAAATRRHTTGTPPRGALVYWGNGQFGHIVVSLGDGKVRSTDYPTKGRVGSVYIHDLEREWGIGGSYLGWSEDLAGRPIKYVWIPPVPAAPANRGIVLANVRPGKRNDDVRRFKVLLWRKLSLTSRQRYWDAWNAEDASTWGPAGQQVLFDVYAWLHTAKGWSAVTKVGGVWPGKKFVAYVGGVAK